MSFICYIAVGSNLGNRLENIRKAVQGVSRLPRTKVVKISALIENSPQGGPSGQKDFLNGALRVETALTCAELLRGFKKIERSLGRRKSVRNGPREVDLDILLCFRSVVPTGGLLSRAKQRGNKPEVLSMPPRKKILSAVKINKPELKVPHPRMFERDFVMRPLLEIL